MIEFILRLALKNIDVDRFYSGIANLRNHFFDERGLSPSAWGNQYGIDTVS